MKSEDFYKAKFKLLHGKTAILKLASKVSVTIENFEMVCIRVSALNSEDLSGIQLYVYQNYVQKLVEDVGYHVRNTEYLDANG